jgi:hypothetical protein
MFDSGYRSFMPRQPAQQHHWHDRQDTKTLTDASWALRRLTDHRRHRGVQPYVAYAACGVLEVAALNITDIDPTVRNSLLHLAQAIARDLDEELAHGQRATARH